MIDREEITAAANEALGDGGLFLVDVVVRGDEIEVSIDSDGTGEDGKPRRVTVDDCVALTKEIEGRFDRDEEDFALTVSSAGVGQPLRVMRQYRKLVGQQVEVVLVGGAKLTATLEAVETGPGGGVGRKTDTENGGPENGNGVKGGGSGAENSADTEGASITLSYSEKRKTEGKKRPEVVAVTKTFPLSEVKTTKEHIDFK